MRVMVAGWVLLLAACGAEPAPVSEAPPPAVIEGAKAPAPPPIVVVSEAELPPAPEGGLTVEGWGKIRVGMTLDEVNAALGSKISLVGDVDYDEYKCTYLDLPDAPGQPGVMFSDGTVARLDVHEPGTATYGGLQVGDTAAKARAVFGKALNSQPHFYSGAPAEYMTIWTEGGPQMPFDGPWTAEMEAKSDAARGVRFETSAAGVIERFRAGSGAIEMVEGCL